MIKKKFTEYIESQFRKPRGITGKICCILMNLINKEMYKNILNSVMGSNESNFLDIGFGNGNLVNSLYNKTSSTIYGIDISADMVKLAEKRNRKAIENSKVHLSIGDCCEDIKPFDIKIYIYYEKRIILRN